MWSENVYSRDILKINNRIDGLENKIDTIVKLNNLRTVS
jgi:hypothetical protein